MQTGFAHGELILEERALRSRSRRLSGRFPYGSRATMSDGGKSGRPQKEEFAPHAFSYRVEMPDEDIHLLIGHSYDKPVASRSAGTLSLEDTDEALTFVAMIHEGMQEASWIKDLFATFDAGLIGGISPGFRLPPPRAVAKSEETVEENPREGNALIRVILAALLYELSLVTRPAYQETKVEARSAGNVIFPVPITALNRWRL